ncbi:L-arabinonate dehydratase [Humisphaera borealis]|uniref:Dihydroxy-acid dehydratase n=1 Tax=Humisphaera borealis TaxID=2807512 RepID=A0A7M2WRQ6_9BACT|nr:L-arabinonate dehydratase [Humisphaera borealis]QOV88198.1 dihydroxy-acid dehydratase [Humisphaera borealis]
MSQTKSSRKTPDQLRSARWFAPDDLRSFGHRSRLKQMGFSEADYVGKPVIAILNTWNDLSQCHTHFPERVEQIKRGILQAGGFPVEIPVMSLSEMFMKPSAMYYRNLLAMEVEENLRCHPIDGAVLVGGCDKTTPGLIMGATSADLPCIYVPAGPMLAGNWKGTRLGSGTDSWKYWAEKCAGNLPDCDWRGVEEGIARSPGTCMTMGTASTMTAIAETLGLSLPGASSIPAVHSAHGRMAAESGRRAVELVWQDLRPSKLLAREAFDNAITVDMAIGGSTNAIVHLIAMAGRAGIKLPLERFDELSQRTPVVANLRPSGEYLMEDFYDAGGLPALLNRIRHLLHTDVITVNGRTLGENVAGAEIINSKVIVPEGKELSQAGATFILRGNLAPDGCVIKPTAAEPRLLKHTGPAVVFENYEELKKGIDDESLPITADSVIVLKCGGPIGAPSMPEWGMLPIPKRLLKQGIRDMVRISDARMSGTSYGTCVLHVAPESAVGGPFALVRTGDLIELDVQARRIHLHVSDEELAVRRSQWIAPERRYERGYAALFAHEVTQANEGCDFRFLHAGKATPEPDIY